MKLEELNLRTQLSFEAFSYLEEFPYFKLDLKEDSLVFELTKLKFTLRLSEIHKRALREFEIMEVLVQRAKEKGYLVISRGEELPFFEELDGPGKELANYLVSTNPWNAYAILESEGYEGLKELIDHNSYNYTITFNNGFASDDPNRHSLASDELYQGIDIKPELSLPLIIDFKIKQ